MFNKYPALVENMLKVTYIGHATVLIEWDGLNILTDPLFSSRVLFFKRLQPLKFDPSRLPKLDAVLLSHAHYDHLDLFSYKFIPGDVPIVIPEGMSAAIKGLVKNPIIELATWSRFTLNPDCEICAVPAKHKGGRFLIPYRYRTCHGYVISHRDEHVYFAGDTAYDSHFSRIRSLFPVKLALLPQAFGKLDWSGFQKAWEDLGQPDTLPIHWGTFFKWWDNTEALKKNCAPNEKFRLVESGETLTL
ncbi:MAG: MBL fold metallo-hydrolase [Deltaproteobacteria bacterium]|nr:MBL fold metallo-hydrolase [Deltaproteobacteria bacterium]